MPDALTVSLPMDAWRVHGIHWVGGHPAVLVDMTGAPETLASGGWGWLAIDLAQREVTSPRTPTGSALDPEYARLWAEAPQSAVVPDTPRYAAARRASGECAQGGADRDSGATLERGPAPA